MSFLQMFLVSSPVFIVHLLWQRIFEMSCVGYQGSHSFGNLENSGKFVSLENCRNFMLDLEFLV